MSVYASSSRRFVNEAQAVLDQHPPLTAPVNRRELSCESCLRAVRRCPCNDALDIISDHGELPRRRPQASGAGMPEVA
jgi:hypothetical protein